MLNSKIALHVSFYAETSGKEPVKEWILSLQKDDRKVIGQDIKQVQVGWPLGMPLVRPLGKGLWEIRSTLNTRIARIIFTVYAGKIILLHGLIKKSQKLPTKDLELAQRRAKALGR